MDPSIILAGIGLGLNLFQGASDSANADKIIEAQHESAVMNTEFQNTERESQFNQQKATIALNKANNENELQFRESNDLANYEFQVAQNTADYDARLAAYTASGQDYETQIGINETAEALALAQTQQKYNDQQTALGFQNQEQLLNQLGQYNSMVTRLDQSQSAIDDALMQETLMETEALRVRNQSYDSANYGLDMIREQAGEAQTTADLQNAQIQERVNASRTGRDEQLMMLDQGKATDNLATDNAIYRNELQTKQQVALQQLQLAQQTGSLEGDLSDKELQTAQLLNRLGIKNEGDNLAITQRQSLLEDEFGTTQLQTQQQIEQLIDSQRYNQFGRDSAVNDLATSQQQNRLGLKSNIGGLNTSQQKTQLQLESSLSGLSTAEKQAQLQLQSSISSLNISGKQNRLSLQSNLSDLQTAAEANNSDLTAQLGKLSEEQQYNLFNRETNVGELGFEFEQSRLQYEQNRAALSFKQEANRIDQLVKSGQISAQGRRGISAARSVNNVLSAAGRQSAQLTDAILRGDSAFKSQVLDIRRKQALADKRFGIQSGSTRRKAGEARTQAEIKARDIRRKKGFATEEFNVNESDIERKKRISREEASISQADIGSRRGLAGKEAGISQADISRQKGLSKEEFDIKSQDLNTKKGLVDRKLGLQKDSTKQRIKDQQALLGRSKLSKDLRISQAEAEREQITKMFGAESSQATDTLARETTNTERKIRQAGEMSDLTIGQTQQSSTQAINDLKEGRALRNDQAYQQAVYVNDKFTNAFNSLTAEQNLLAENLQQQLNSYSRETGKLNQQKDFAEQNYNVAYQAAQEVHDSAMRKYNDTAADVERERDRLATQDRMIEDQYQASLQSAEQAKLASEGQISLDRYSADVTADKALMPEPVLAPDPPKPMSYPRTAYPELTDEHKPQLLPEPIKGQHGGVQFAGAIANFASDLAGVDWGS